MKKLLLFIVALFTLSTVHAELILHESFDRSVGKLSVANTPAANNTDWYSFSGEKDYISVVEGSLSYAGYAEATGKKVELLGNGADDLRQFAPITSGKVYVAAIINVDSLKPSGSAEYFLSLGDATNSGMWARLYYKSVDKVDGNFTGFNLGVTKYSESSTAYGWAEQKFLPKTNYLVVIEYEFVDGEKNDTVRLYINPTKSNKKPLSQCVQDYVSGSGKQNGASGKDDASKIASVNLRKATATPGRVYVDEIKVATTWDELFEEGGVTPPVEEPAEITVTPTSFGYLQGLVGQTYTQTFTVNGKNLKEDITLTSDNAEVTLDKYTISKDAATDVVVTMTIAPKTDGYGTYKITLTSGEATATVTQLYWNVNVSTATTIAELNTLATAASGYDYVYIKYTGEAVVTYKYNQGGDKLYLQDATAGVFINDSYWGDEIKQGDKVTNCMVYVDPTNVVSGMKYIGTQTGIEVLSHGNEVTPQVVTLADLKNNAADYLNKLVKVENVTLDQRSTTFKGTDADGDPIPDKITQNSNEATLSIVDSNPLVGTTKPKKADIIGISTNKVGSAIRPRGLADVISKDPTTAIENIALDMLNGDYEIYTVSGMRVDALQPGVNIIRQGDKTYKVVR